ncbi:MAG: succinate dehydrogenase, cytochrome b556 subunit [Sphingobium sp.]
MARTGQRPLSPHLGVYRWGPHMTVSILHRVAGDGLAIVGGIGLTWWLFAAASGPDAYATFLHVATSWIGYVFLIGLTWAFFEHLFSGLRHLVLDTGAGYELQSNRFWSLAVMFGAVFVTAAIWAFVFLRGL